MRLRGRAHDDTTYGNTSVEIRYVAEEDHASSAHGTRAEVWATPVGSTTLTKVLTIQNDGNLNIAAGKTYNVNGVPIGGGGSGGGAVESVTGDGVDNTDPANPVLSFPTPADIGAQVAGTYLTSSNIEDSIIDGHTTIAPSGNAVFDALALKQAGDFLSILTAVEISITTATALTISRMHVISGSTNFTPTLPPSSGNAGKFIGARFTNTGITTMDADGTETIDGVLTRKYYQGQTTVWMCDGSNWHTVFGVTAQREVSKWGYEFITSYTKTISADANQYLSVIYRLGNANGDTGDANIYLTKGTYTVYILGLTSTQYGKVDWTLNGTSVTTGQDWYSASLVYNVEKSFLMTVPFTGDHVLHFVMNGHNGSSSSYRFACNYMYIIPSAF
jgi:hypothetical protein